VHQTHSAAAIHCHGRYPLHQPCTSGSISGNFDDVVTGGFITDVTPYSLDFRIPVTGFSVTQGVETVLMSGDGNTAQLLVDTDGY